MLMEAGASAKSVERVAQTIAQGLGARLVELSIGYASLAITAELNNASITRLRKVGELRVNQRLIQAFWELGARVAKGQLTSDQTRMELSRLRKDTLQHPAWTTALAIGIGCAAFGRLLGVDWQGTGPILLAATTGQYFRRVLINIGRLPTIAP